MTPNPSAPLTSAAVVDVFADLMAVGARKPPESWSIDDARKRDAMVRRAAEVWIRQLDGWTLGELRAAVDAYAATEFGGMWPTPADLIRVGRPVPTEDAAAWRDLRPRLGGPVAASTLSARALAGLRSIPDAFTRRRMAPHDLDGLRGPFLAGCGAYAARVEVQTAEPRQIAESAPDFSELLLRAGCVVPEPVRQVRAGGER